MLKPNKTLAQKAVITLVPQYVEFFRGMQKGGNRTIVPSPFSEIQSKVGFYVKLYVDERFIGNSLSLALLGEEQFSELSAGLEAMPPDEQQAFLDDIVVCGEEIAESIEAFFYIPISEEERKTALEQFNALSAEEQEFAKKQFSFFWSYFFSSLLNTLSLMVHGAKLTTLVPQAINGDDAAFLKAVQIDRMLLLHHPYFIERKKKAQDSGEAAFLRGLLRREIESPFRSRIQYPGLYMLFGILQAFQWLDDMTHEEILDLVDEAGLDRYQSRVEDVNYLTKRLLEYRRWQSLNVLSMP
jgi:hypothetical protein